VTTRQVSLKLPFKVPCKLNANVIAVAVIALLVALVVPLVLVIGNSRAAQRHITLRGTLLDGRSAPTFALHDQSGDPISLAILQGHPMVLMFLDATCSQNCPSTAQALNQTAQLMGSKSAEIEWVAITTNPANTGKDARDFITKHQLAVPLEFLLGSRDQLTPVWMSYHIQVASAASGTQANESQQAAGLFLVDREGHERVWLAQGFDPTVLSGDLQALLS
jgi:cytochrome oxidase Cu insertion factor (SCO1/SenC/PrrC family)